VRGLKSSVPGHSSVLYALTPLGVLMLSSALERRLPPRAKLIGVLVALSGAVVVLRPWKSGAEAAEVRRGDLLLLLAVVAWVVYTVAVRGVIRRHDPRTVTAWSLVLGTLAMMPLGARALKSTDWSAVPASAWWGLAWMVAISSVTMMLLWSALLRHLHPVEVSVCMNAQPPATALLQVALTSSGVVAFPTALGAPFLAGMALVLAGAAIVQREPARR
jgi:drug/metabolite transporter (DMT)-like permease